MAKKVPLFYGFSGINNIVKATRIGIAENAFAGLENANNVFVDAGGVLETVPDAMLRIDGAFHSLWGVNNKFYCVKDESSSSTIYQCEVVNGSIVMRTVVTGLTKEVKISFTILGDVVYYSNGTDNGRIDGVTGLSWPSQRNNRLVNLVDFVPGTHIDALASRILTIVGDEIRFTESFLPGLYDGIKNARRLSSNGRMIYSVGTGAYVSDADCIYFIRGVNPNEWKLEKVLEYPAIEHGRYTKLVDPVFFGLPTRQPAALFNTENGLCIGLDSGEVYNLTEKKYRQTADCNALAILEESLVLLSDTNKGLIVQGVNEDIGGKAVTEWYGGFNSLYVDDANNVIGADDSGLSLLWGQPDITTTGLEMLDEVEMISVLEMI